MSGTQLENVCASALKNEVVELPRSRGSDVGYSVEKLSSLFDFHRLRLGAYVKPKQSASR